MIKRKIVVLDDDPTGIQTVNGIYVFTEWDTSTIKEGLLGAESIFYILTNSRALTKQETIELHHEIGRNLVDASKETGVDFIIISRGDSTLRGHYPFETETLRKTIEGLSDKKFDGEIICPFFMEGGRITKNGVHYLAENGSLTPVGETEFAHDRTFSFIHSDLSEYVEEKTQGEYKANECLKITVDLLIEDKLSMIHDILLEARDFRKIIVDGTSYEEMAVFKCAFEQAIDESKNYIIRSAASLPRILGSIAEKPLLVKAELVAEADPKGGLVIVGSHVDKTNRQLNKLMTSSLELEYLEFDAQMALSDEQLKGEFNRVRKLAEDSIKKGKTVVIYTSRTLLTHSMEEEEKLKMSVKLSWGVSQVVNTLAVKPKFIIGKGGITSSDIGTIGLQVKKAKVLGQVKPGIPVWETDEHSKFPKIPYIIFPGNVGNDETLLEIVSMLL
jgi:uncharacterized protein YgbK (DUF1537 family)